MPIVLLFLKRWFDSPKKPAQQPALATMVAENSSVSSSPFAGGSGINQNVNAPVFNVNIGHAAPGPVESTRAAPAPFQRPLNPPEAPVAETPKANIAFCSAGNVFIGESLTSDGLFFQLDSGKVAATVQFSNDAIVGAKIIEGRVNDFGDAVLDPLSRCRWFGEYIVEFFLRWLGQVGHRSLAPATGQWGLIFLGLLISRNPSTL